MPPWWNTPGQVDSNGRYVIVILNKPYKLLKAGFGCDLLSTFSISLEIKLSTPSSLLAEDYPTELSATDIGSNDAKQKFLSGQKT